MVKHTSSSLYLSKNSAHILRLQHLEFIQTSVQMIPFTGNLVIVLHLEWHPNWSRCTWNVLQISQWSARGSLWSPKGLHALLRAVLLNSIVQMQWAWKVFFLLSSLLPSNRLEKEGTSFLCCIDMAGVVFQLCCSNRSSYFFVSLQSCYRMSSVSTVLAFGKWLLGVQANCSLIWFRCETSF